MTNEELIAKIREEIERRQKSLRAGICNPDAFIRKQKLEMLVASEELDRFNRFLSTLEESEKPMNPEEVNELEKESDKLSDELFCEFFPEDGDMITPSDFRVGLRKFARHFYELGCRRTAEKYDEIEYNRQRNAESVPSDLEEAADNHIREVVDAAGHPGWDWETKDIAEAFIAGAKWQADHTPLPEDTVLFNKGVAEGRRLERDEFEKNRLAACSNQTEEEYDRETDFALGIIKKEHRQPTFSDAINYGMRLQKEQMMDEWLKDRDGCFWDGVAEGKKAMEDAVIALIESRLSEIIGDAQPRPALRAELQELITKCQSLI